MQSNSISSIEEWRPVAGYEGIYEVSSQGRVRSLDRVSDVPAKHGVHRRLKGKVLKQVQERRPGGYMTVSLFKNGIPTRLRVHALVCEAFHGERPKGMVTRHLNGDSTDNRPENLMWGSYEENGLDITRHGRNHNAAKTHCPQGHPYDEVNTIHARRGNGRKFRACRTCQRAVSEKRRNAA